MMGKFSDLARIAGPSDDRPPFSFAAACRVAFSDTDAQSIVYYGRYAPYFDVARVEYFRYLKLDLHENRRDAGQFVMRHFEIDYHAPAQYDDLLEVFCRVAKVGRTSITFEFAVTRAEDQVLLATASQVLVNVDLGEQRSTPIPDSIRSLVENFEHAPG